MAERVKKRARFEQPPSPQTAPPTKAAPALTKAAQAQAAKPTELGVVIVAGTYERFLYGLQLSSVSDLASKTAQLKPVFAFPAHLSSIRDVCATSSGNDDKVSKYVLSGGTDETIKVWDIRRKKEVGALESPNAGTVTCMKHCAAQNMLLVSTSEATISLYRIRDWVLLRTLKGHKGRINSVDPHPNGRVALSVGQDKMLRMWDLLAGKSVATTKLGQEGDVVRWNDSGSKFAVACSSTVQVFDTSMTLQRTLLFRGRVHDVRFIDTDKEELLFVACEDSLVRIYALEGEKDSDEAPPPPKATLAGHTNRVKMMDSIKIGGSTLVTTVSSDGMIHLYDLAGLEGSTALEPVAKHDTQASRLTCVTIASVPVTAGAAEDSESSEEDEDEEDSDDESDSD